MKYYDIPNSMNYKNACELKSEMQTLTFIPMIRTEQRNFGQIYLSGIKFVLKFEVHLTVSKKTNKQIIINHIIVSHNT